MPRRARAEKREVRPDPKYRSPLVSQMIVKIMLCGKKRTAENIVYGALDKLSQRVSKDPVAALEQAVREAAGRGTDIERNTMAHVDSKGVQRRRQFVAAAADIARR